MPNFTQEWMRIQDASARRGDAPETIEGLRQQYFATRIAPEIIKRGGDDQTLQLAAQRFDSETKGKFSASQSILTPEEQELARQDKQGTAGLNAAGDILKSFAGRVANSSADIASGLGSLIPFGGKERDSWSQVPANIIRGGAQRLMDETSQTTKDAYESKAGKAADFVLGAVPYVATMGISKVPAIAGLGTAGKLATGATVGFAGGYGATTEQARQSLDRISDEDLKRSILDQAAVDQKAPAVQAYIDANGDLRKTRDLLANHAGNVGGSIMAAASPLIGMLGGTAGKVLANRAVGKLVEEGVSEPIARRMVAKSIADEAAKQTIGGVAKRVGTDMLMQGTGMGAAMAGGQYAATGAVADAMGRDRTDEEKAQIAHAGIEGFVGGALAAPFFTAMHKVDSAREQLDADARAAKSAASEIKSQQNEMLAIARQRSEAQAAGDVNGIASADQSFQQAQQVIAANKEKLRQLNADDEGNLLGRDGNKTLVQQAKSLADVARNALTRSKADAIDQTNTAIQTGIADQAAAIDRARRIERQYNDTGEIQQPAQNSPQAANTAYFRKQAQGDEAKTPHFDAAAGALSDAGGDLNRAINILRRKSPDLSPNQAAEEVVRAHRIIRNQQNNQEGAEVPQQPEQVSRPIDPEQAKRGLIDLAEQGDLQGLRQSAADLANGDENAYNALMDSAFTGAKLRKDAAAKAASDAQKAQATDAAMVEKAKQHIAKSGGDLVDAAMRMRAANKSLTPAQASEYVTRAHMDLNRPAMEQANAQEAASAARPVNGIAGFNEQPTGNIIDGTATPIDYGPDVRPSVSTQAAIDRSPARASLPAPTAQDRLPSPDTAGTPSIKPDTVIQVGPEGTAMPRPARTIQEEARQRRDVTVPSGTKAKVERPARADQQPAISGQPMPGTIQEAAKAVAPAAKAEQAATGMEVEFGGKRYPVDSLADASAKWQEYVGRNNLGVSDVGNGVPVYSGGKQIARVSYNGRLWDMQGKEIAQEAPQGSLHVRNPATGEETQVKSIEDAARKYKAMTQKAGKSLDSGMDVYDSSTGQPVANINADGAVRPVETMDQARARSEAAVAKLNNEQPKTIQQAASEIKPEVTPSKPEMTPSAAGKPTTQPKKATAKPVVDPERDNLLVAIAKLGGINREQAKAQGGFDPAEMNRRAGGLLPIFRKTGGQNLDRMAEMLHERGYPVSENGSYTVNALLDALDHAMRGGDVGTPMYHERKAQAEYEARQQEQDIPFDEPGTNWVDAASDSWMTEAVNNEIKPDAVAASELRSIEDEQRKPSAPGASGQEADTGAKADGGPARAGEAVAGREGGQPEGQGVSRQGTGGQAGELTLESYTEADLAKRAEAIRKQQEEEKRKAESERLKAQADRELKDFRLSGSSAPADVAVAGGQGSLIAPKTRGEREAEKAYAERNSDRIRRIGEAATKDQVAKIVSEEEADPERHFEGTSKVSNAARQKERDIRGTEAKAAEQAALDRGERVDVPGKIYQSYEDADRAARDMNDEGDGYFYEPKVFLNDDSHARYVMTKRKVTEEEKTRLWAKDAAAHLKDIVYSLDNLVGDNQDLLATLATELGKSARDGILMDQFGIDRATAHEINNSLDARKPHKLRAVDMRDVLEQYPALKRIIDNAKEELRLRNDRKASAQGRITPTSAGDMKAEKANAEVPADTAHLSALQLRLSNERIRLSQARTEQEKIARTQIVDGIEKEIAGEREFLGLPKEDKTPIDEDELLAQLGVENHPKTESAAKQTTREMTEEGRAKDGKPIMPGDKFKTSSGRETTPYPKQKGEKYASQWLIDNATAEAEARGDGFNAPIFRRTSILKDGTLTTADRDSMLMYLFGEQPKVKPSIFKPMTTEKPQSIQDHAKALESQKKSEPEVAPTDSRDRAPAASVSPRDSLIDEINAAIKDADSIGLTETSKRLQELNRDVHDRIETPENGRKRLAAIISDMKNPLLSGDWVSLGKGRIVFRWEGMGYGRIEDTRITEDRGDNVSNPWRTSDGTLHGTLRQAKKHESDTSTRPRLERDGYIQPEGSEKQKQSADYGSSNKLVTKDRAAEIRAKEAADKAAQANEEQADAKKQEEENAQYIRELDQKRLLATPADAVDHALRELSPLWNKRIAAIKQGVESGNDYQMRQKMTFITRDGKYIFAPAGADGAVLSGVGWDVVEIPASKVFAKAAQDGTFDAFTKRLGQGKVTLDEFKRRFDDLTANKDAVMAELSAKTKDQLLSGMSPMKYARYRNDKKDAIVRAAYGDMLTEFTLHKSLTYGMDGPEPAVRRMVANMTEADLAEYARRVAERRKEIDEARKNYANALENPQSLEDYRAYIRAKREGGMTYREAFLSLNPEQREKYDALEAEATKSRREERQRAEKTRIEAAQQKTGASIVETKHTQKGHDLFVVKLDDRVDRDSYNTLNAAAKRLGGYYSSYRAGGAVPGFQFTDRANAEAFSKLVQGDTAQAKEAINEKRDAFEDNKAQSAADRLDEMAQRLEETADAALSAERKTNTARRARFADAAMREAYAQQAMAKTMRNLSESIRNGSAKFLGLVRQKVQIETLNRLVASAHENYLKDKYKDNWYSKREEPVTKASADHADFPTFTAWKSDLATLGRQLMQIPGAKRIGEALAKTADDVTDDYLAFARDNIPKVSPFHLKDGSRAVFSSKEAAENAIYKSGLSDRAIVLPVKRGENRIILSPKAAADLGVWNAEDKRITLKPDFADELVGKMTEYPKQVTQLHGLLSAKERIDRLKGMGIETPTELRAALREYIGLKEEAKRDKIKEMELSMVGRQNDGLDFFPTPEATVDRMIEEADIKPGMSVLEPEAGMGHIADRLRESGHEPEVMEISPSRRELLLAKGYRFPVEGEGDFTKVMPRTFHTFGDTFKAPDGTVGIMRGQGGMGSDRVRLDDEQGNTLGYYNREELTPVGHRGTASGYDRIIMNPPFSNRQDAAHVMHAYDHLAGGGRLVAIVGEGVFNGSDAKAVKFREWLSEHGARIEKLDAGTFNDPSLPVTTQANARMVVIDKKAAPDIGKGDVKFSTANGGPGLTVERARQLIDTDPVLSKASRFIDIKNSTDEIPSGAELLYSPAWHGSPHSFDKFSLDHIGTGEGAQAYGWGLYFAGNKEVAEYYRKTLAGDVDFENMEWGSFPEPAKGSAAARLAGEFGWDGSRLKNEDDEYIDDVAKERGAKKRNIGSLDFYVFGDGSFLAVADGGWDVGQRGTGKLYHVEIPDDGTYLLWDKPLSEQPEAVKKAIDAGGKAADAISELVSRENLYRGVFNFGDSKAPHEAITGKEVYAELSRASGGDEQASKYLHSLGISGIKYLDGSSRSKGEGNYNYVVFDDNAVKIIDRYSARKNQAEGYYHNGKITLFADNIAAFHNQSAEERLKWVAFHELTHRGVAKLAESREYLDALDRAGQNPFIKNLASKIMEARKGSPYEVTRSIATEEALAEVSAALQTGDVSHLKDRYGLNFPESIRTAAKTAMQRFFEVVKRIFNRLTGRGLTDQQVGELLGRTMKSGLERGESSGEATSGPAAMRYSVIDDVKDRISEEAKAVLASDSQLSLLNRTLGTKLNIALRIPAYKAVHDKVRAFLNHTNVEAFEAVNKAPELLARNEDASDYKRELKRLDPRFWSKDQAVKVEERNILAAAKVIYENTLRADAENKKVFTDAELRAKGLNDEQIRVYRTFMDAVNVSLDNFAKANITRLMMQAGVIDGDAAVRLHNKELPLNEHLANLREQAGQMAERLQDNINSGDDSAKTARELDVVKAAIDSSNDIADKANRLKAEGYAPAMRFGEHTVTAYDESGRVAYFEGFDSKTAAIRAEKAFKEENPKWRVVRGTMSQEKFKQFQGLTPETVALFAKEAGYENDPAYQEYLKLAINNSSPLKRMIHRKGIAGYSQDLPRVLSSFVMSNARGSSRAIFSGQMQDALSALKQAHPHDGKLYDDAAKLVDYVVNPKEEAQFLKNMLFHFYLAGSFGFGLVNLLQPLHMTSAQIALYNGGKAGEAVKTVAGSYKRAVQAMRTGKPPQEYAEAFKRAQREGYLDPANTYALQGIERGRSGYAHTWLGAASHALSSIARITETINRTSTFIAAMDFAKATGEANLRKAGFKDAYDFATRAIDVTQGVYDKSNRPNAARGAVGSLLMAYKMYPINFIEFGARMAKEGLKGNPAGYTGLAMLLGVLAVTSGVTGLPLVQDLIDALEGIFAGFGHPFNADRFMREHMKPEAADVLMHGVGAVPGAPFDIASRMSMGRQVPGLPQLINPTLSDDESRRAGQQLGGAAENLLLNFYDAYKLAFGQGKYEEAVIQASPKWAKSVAKAFEMATKGEYTDSKGRKVRDVTALDAIVKALDIQPASITRQQRIRGIEMQDLSIQKNKEKYFADRMFDAAMDNDSTAMLQAQADLEKWNRDNPLYQVNIDYQRQVGRRVIEARKGPAQRLKTPKEMRWIQGEAMDASQ